MLKASKIRLGVVIAKTDVAIGLRGDATPDLSTPAKVKAAMLNARSLRWADTGAALFTVNKILDTLEIRDAVKAKHDMSPRRRRSGRVIADQHLSAQRNHAEQGPS